jgi:hypothetical protein
MAKEKIVYLGPRGFDSLILPQVVLRLPMPPEEVVPAQAIFTQQIRIRGKKGRIKPRMRDRIAGITAAK